MSMRLILHIKKALRLRWRDESFLQKYAKCITCHMLWRNDICPRGYEIHRLILLYFANKHAVYGRHNCMGCGDMFLMSNGYWIEDHWAVGTMNVAKVLLLWKFRGCRDACNKYVNIWRCQRPLNSQAIYSLVPPLQQMASRWNMGPGFPMEWVAVLLWKP